MQFYNKLVCLFFACLILASAEGAAGLESSGLEGTTNSVVMPAVPGGQSSKKPISREFTLVPIEKNKPIENKSIAVKSDSQGKYHVALSPGKYAIEPAQKNRNSSINASRFMEKEVMINPGAYTYLELNEVNVAP